MATRRALVTALAAVALAAAPAFAAKPKAKPAPKPAAPPAEFSMGSPKAKVQVVEYASLSCPHCARWNEEVFPAFKARYVDTGKVRYTLREMLTPPAEVAAAGFILARCAGPGKYFKVVDQVFRSQSKWGDGGAIEQIFTDIAKDNGLTHEQFEACMNDQKALAALNGRVQTALDAGVNSTPTFFVNGKKIAEGEVTLDKLDAAIAAAGKPQSTKPGG